MMASSCLSQRNNVPLCDVKFIICVGWWKSFYAHKCISSSWPFFLLENKKRPFEIDLCVEIMATIIIIIIMWIWRHKDSMVSVLLQCSSYRGGSYCFIMCSICRTRIAVFSRFKQKSRTSIKNTQPTLMIIFREQMQCESPATNVVPSENVYALYITVNLPF